MAKTKQFNIPQLREAIFQECPHVLFAYLFGSAQNGTIKKKADVDIALYLSDIAKKTNVLLKVIEIAEKHVGNTPVDIVFFKSGNLYSGI